jgi:peptide/nickel transport system permease protein
MKAVAVHAASVIAPRPRLNRSGLIGAALLGLMILLALLADLLAGDPAALGAVGDRLLDPSTAHPMGTDVLGRDVMTRLFHGARVSLLVGSVSVLMSVGLGTLIGVAAGMGPAWLDRSLMSVTDLFLAFPRIFLVLMLVALLSPSLYLVMLVLGLTGWMGVARLVRAEVLTLREREFVWAARGLGLSTIAISIRHILPNILSLIVVAGALRLGNTILLEAFLSFIGLGAQEPMVSWGAMIEHGRAHLLDGWWLTVFPGLAIATTVVGCNLLGDAIHDRLDPMHVDRKESHERWQSSGS